jgi:ferredoxin-NADP reductase
MIGDFDDWDVATASGRTKVNVSSSTKPTRTSDFEWKKGRPKYDALLNDLTPATTCVLACGPAPMVNDVQSKSLSCGFDFHKEIFSF